MGIPNTSPIHLGPPQTINANVATANTARDGSGSITNLFTATATANGAELDQLRFNHGGAIGTPSTAMMVRLWHTKSAAVVMIKEYPLPTATPTIAAAGASVTVPQADLPKLAPSESLGYTISASEKVFAYGVVREY